MTSHLLVREAADSDVEAIASMFRQEAELHDRLENTWSLRADFDWPALVRSSIGVDDRTMLVAVLDDAPVGFISVRLRGLPMEGSRRAWPIRMARWLLQRRSRSSLPIEPSMAMVNSPFGTIEDCYVAEDVRRRGVGLKLVEEGVRWLQNRAITRVQLQVASTNEGAVRFWQRCGFVIGRLRMDRILGEKNRDPRQ